MSKMSDKDILLACKEDNPIQYLMESYGYDSKYVLFEDIKKIYPVACDSLIGALSGKNDVPEAVGEESEEPVLIVSEEPAPEELEEFTSSESEEPAPEVGPVSSDELAKLKQMEENFSKMVIGFESQIKDLNGERSKNCARLNNAKKALLELQKIISSQKDNLKEIVTKISEINAEINKLNVEKAQAKTDLEKVRNQIKLLQKVTIRVLKDATISIDNKNTPEVNELSYAENFSRIFALPYVGKLRVDDVRALAILLEMVKQYESYEIIFEDPEMQKIWENLK